MAMAALETGTRSASTLINDPGFYMFGGHRFGSPDNEKGGIMDMRRSIVESSNPYYYSLANELGVDAMHDFMKPLGFGQITGIDIHGEVRGVLPSQDWKRKYYKRPEQKKWYAGETISLGIGQGYNSFTMLQLAQATATLVNKGVKHKPQLVIATQDATTRVRTPIAPAPAQDLGYKPENADIILRAVSMGKREKYNAAKMEEHQRDHSLYIAFAPEDVPQIALAVIVENAGFGSAAAAPIARRAFDYWLMGQYPGEEDLAAVSKGLAGAPIGKPRLIANMVWPPVAAPEKLPEQ